MYVGTGWVTKRKRDGKKERDGQIETDIKKERGGKTEIGSIVQNTIV